MAIKNRYARPRRQPGRLLVSLPEVIERPEEYDGIRLMQMVGEPCDPENIAVWEFTYRCEYESGLTDQGVDVRQIIAGKGAAGRAKAIRTLQELMAGFGIARIILYDARGPMTVEQVQKIRAMNEELDWIKKVETTKSTKGTK